LWCPHLLTPGASLFTSHPRTAGWEFCIPPTHNHTPNFSWSLYSGVFSPSFHRGYRHKEARARTHTVFMNYFLFACFHKEAHAHTPHTHTHTHTLSMDLSLFACFHKEARAHRHTHTHTRTLPYSRVFSSFAGRRYGHKEARDHHPQVAPHLLEAERLGRSHPQVHRHLFEVRSRTIPNERREEEVLRARGTETLN